MEHISRQALRHNIQRKDVVTRHPEARALAEGGMTEAAREALADARREAEGDTARSARPMAEACLALGEWKAASAALRIAPPQQSRPFVMPIWEQLARARARAGQARAILDWAEAEADPEARLHALIGLLDGIADTRNADTPR